MNQYESILKEYWGYDKFRPLQLEIIESTCSGKDTLGVTSYRRRQVHNFSGFKHFQSPDLYRCYSINSPYERSG